MKFKDHKLGDSLQRHCKVLAPDVVLPRAFNCLLWMPRGIHLQVSIEPAPTA